MFRATQMGGKKTANGRAGHAIVTHQMLFKDA